MKISVSFKSTFLLAFFTLLGGVVAPSTSFALPSGGGSSTPVALDAPISITTNGSAATAENYTAYPLLNVGAVPPLVMLVMSRDEQLYIKAYTDYTDLNGDGVVDTTYQDGFDYSGYFDPKLCYGYSSGIFKAAAKATDINGNGKAHECDGSHWSGNFLNWSAMSRIDVLRFVLYGGKRSTDDASKTVLERSYIPSDLHAWAKVYPGSDVNYFTPFTTTQTGNSGLSMCNVSHNAGDAPVLMVAKGNYAEWASTAREQCRWREDVTETGADINLGDSASKAVDGLGNDEYTVRVEVCDPAVTSSLRESFCEEYDETDASGNITVHTKPVGLLQRYGEQGQMRFGLLTGTYSKPRAGGVLRRNIGLFTGNASGTDCVYDPTNGRVDEVNLKTGQFCNQKDDDEGIINTLNRFTITSWDASKDVYTDCNTYGILQRQVGKSDKYLADPAATGGYACKDSGNPLAEMYAEALRYIKGKAPTSTFSVSDASIVTGLPLPSWKDPYRAPEDGGNPYCANCSIIVITTGLDSFDGDAVPTVEGLAKSAADATDEVGTDEDLSGALSGKPPKYLVGRTGALDSTTYQDICTPKFISALSSVYGVCPDVPSLEGSYLMAGLAYEAWTQDMRPDKTGTQKVQTYAIALAETLPTFQISVRASSTTTDLITITPACQANNDGSAALGTTAGWRSCYLGNLTIGTKTSKNITQSAYLKLVSGQAATTSACDPAASVTGNRCRVFGLPYQVVNGAPVSGSFTITWEDSQWGNDHDNDVVEMLSFCKGSACLYDGNGDKMPDICEGSTSNGCNNVKGIQESQILVRTDAISGYAGNALQIGYTTAGAFNAGNGQEASGAKFTVLRPGDTNGSTLSGTDVSNVPKWTAPQVEKYTSGPAEQLPLPNPLFFAAKYGGFADQNGDGKPDRLDSPEWDKVINDTGAEGQDGQPDNYYLVRNPANLAKSLASTFDAILKRSGSGTAAAVVANSANGVGTIYQALYQAERKDSAGRAVDWSGTLNGLWTDSFGRLRENASGLQSDGSVSLHGYDVDPVIEFYYDTTDNQTKFHRELMPANTDGSPVTVFDKTKASITDHTLDELRSIWSAQKQLWDTSFPTGVASDLTSTNRTYSDSSTTGRYLFTWIDANHNGVVDLDEQQPFVFSGSSGAGFYGSVSGGSKPTYSGNFRFLNTASPDVAKRIVAWVRGYDVQDVDSKGNPLWRRRLVDYNNDGTLRELRLGDIVDSTPVVAGTPSEAFDLLYGDTSYGTFRQKYRQRRQVIYVGANDGMLHAFNAGFYDARNQRIQLYPTGGDSTSVTQYPLGGEIWAYVPGNLLPHLRWLADPQYKHNFYVDGSPIVQDVKIFDADDTHPDGWGTVLIAPFRFGGGPISVNTNPSTTTTATPQNSFSAYVVLDVTDPEQKPKLLAEITNTELSDSTVKCGTAAGAPSCADITKVIDTYTSSVPAVAIFRDATSSSPNKFYLFTGSGTTDNGGVGTTEGGDAVATTALKVRAFDMTSLSAPAKTFSMQNIGSANAGANSFAGDLIASDFNLDGRSEGLYFGSTKVSATPGVFGGALWKLNFNGDPDPTNWTPQQMISDLGAPVTIRPTVARNDRGAPMVFAGTGRAYSKNDLSSVQQQKIIGMVDTSLLPSTDDQYHTLPLAMGDLVDVTGIAVNTDSTVTGDATATDYDALVNSFNSADRLGWYLNLTAPSATTDTTPSERVVSTQSLLGGVLLTTTFFPGTDTCTDVGRGALYGLNYKTGTAFPSTNFFGTTSSGSKQVVNRSTDLGPGLPAPPSLHVGDGSGPRKLTACVQTSTGAIICKEITTLKSVTSSEISWREPLDR